MSSKGRTPTFANDVLELICDVAARELVLRFDRLTPAEVHDKGGGELVTSADLAAEAALAAGLTRILPGSFVVGEEASHSDPTMLQQLERHEWLWLVDALDGTHDFARGREPWGVLVALLRFGEVDSAWIHLPLRSRTAWGSREVGVHVDGAPVVRSSPPPVDQMRGPIFTRFLPDDLKTAVEDAARQLQRTDGDHPCAAQHYIGLLLGRQHFALYYRTSPWDHAGGAFLVQEAGGTARRFDGGLYKAIDGSKGLLIAPDAVTWRELDDLLLCGVPLAETVTDSTSGHHSEGRLR